MRTFPTKVCKQGENEEKTKLRSESISERKFREKV